MSKWRAPPPRLGRVNPALLADLVRSTASEVLKDRGLDLAALPDDVGVERPRKPEHGAIWIAYNPDQVTGDALETLRSKVDGEPYTLMSPYPGLDQPISLQSWGHQLKLSEATDPRIDQFIAALRLNQYTYPEPGASCNEVGSSGGFSQDDPPPFVPAPAPGSPGSHAETAPGSAVTPDMGS